MILSWQQIPSPVITEIISKDYDGTVLDTEHGCFNNETLYTCIQVLKLQKKKCLVRLKGISKSMIGMCLDAGANGLIFSSVETKEQCEEISRLTRFPIDSGTRGSGLVRENFWGEYDSISPRTRNPILIPQIETKKAVDNLNRITAYNFHYYLIGPYDLSSSLLCPGEFDNEKYMSYINKISEFVPSYRLGIHIPNDIENQIEKYKDYELKCLGMDTIALLKYHNEVKKYVKF